MSKLVILGNDKIGGLAYKKLHNLSDSNIYIDKSANLRRIFILLLKKRINIRLVCKMIVSEFMRSGNRPPKNSLSLNDNNDLLNVIKQGNYSKILLFRAGLIINKSVIDTGLPILNIHAAKVPDFGGIGSIDRALRNKAFNQFASLHVVTTKIDEGEVIDKEHFVLDPEKSYFENERLAYDAAICLLLRVVFT